jgi:DNA-directed RNA polymerase subunit H
LVENKEKKSNIFEHVFVPKHVLLSKEEKDMFLDSQHVLANQLPYIKVSDPAVRAIEAKPGDIVKVIRKSPTAREAITYRYVIDD